MASDLLSAAKNGYFSEVVHLLTSNGPCDVNARDKDKATPLYWSASRGHLKICEVLITAGCDVNACVKWGSTALHAAADRGHVDCLVALISSEAQVNIQNERGDTALHLAAYRGFKDIAQELVKAWADPFIKNNQSKTPLQEALSQQHLAVADVIQKYVESLGCLPFKSLPDWHRSRAMMQSPQTQRGYSEPGASWPQCQSFPKFPDNIPPKELSRPHTFPIKTFNNLSGEPSGSGIMGGNTKGNCGFGETSGVQGGPINPQGHLYRHAGFFQQYTHPEPEENCEHCGDNPNNSSNGLMGGGSCHNGVRTVRLEVDSPPLYQQQYHLSGIHTNKVINQNGQRRGIENPNNPEGMESIASYLTPPPDLVPPTNPHSGPGFVKHEDLTEFAESLQLEVVKLRDSLTCKEKQVSELHVTMASLVAQNARLQRELSDANQRAVSQDVLAFKEAQLAELREQVSRVEKQNACLQQALSQQQERAKDESALRDSALAELTTKVKNLERLNSTLQQLIVNQQDTLIKKDAEHDQLKQTVNELFREKASLSEAVFAKRQEDCVATEISGQSCEGLRECDKTPVDSSSRNVLSSAVTSRTDAAQSANVSGAHPGTPNVTSRSVISFCDQSAIHPSVPHTRPATTYTPGFYGQGIAASPVSGFSTLATSDAAAALPLATSSNSKNSRAPHFHSSTPDVPASMTDQMSSAQTSSSSVTSSSFSQPQSVSNVNSRPAQGTGSSPKRDTELAVLREAVSRLYHDGGDAGKLDADGREWTVGKEFQLLDARPVNCASDGQRSGSCSLIFRIGHNGRKYVLKMLMNLINLTYETHSLGRSLDAHLLHRFGAEFHAPLLLHPHPNIVRVRHHYQGDTTHFRNYLHLLVPANLDVPLEMARRTTFLVMDQYPQTLQSFLNRHGPEGGGSRAGGGEGGERGAGVGGGGTTGEASAQALRQLPEQFFVQLVYQLLSAVAYLQSYHVVHRDIKADNIFLDWRLRPVLGDFGLARTLRTYDGKPVAFTDRDQVFAGNAHAWAPELSRCSKVDPGEASCQSMTLEDIYSKSDAFAVSRMIYHLFGADGNGDFTSSSATTANTTPTTSSDSAFPTSSQSQPHYPDSAVPVLPRPLTPELARVLKSLVLDDPARRPTVEEARRRVGWLLCKPTNDITSLQEAEEFYISQLRSLSSKSIISSGQLDDCQTLSVADSVEANQNSCLADFLLNFSATDFWETHKEMRTLGLQA